ncbi:transcription-repair coupling factor [Lactobacillus sp. S2-2]|uniref:transcription-repair coupling factor n=1 Tax=Lactobacillus sp. S2-2 TaxID=2692917 RepID=UPI001F0035EE|nr:transcription-repair coupling factor [Lactobacillus sp. S2-2]MCF6515874.1 transcription-repair coupling factor [Lactobacillus sp. S2-2]
MEQSDLLLKLPKYTEIKKQIEQNKHQLITGMNESSKLFLMDTIKKNENKNILVVTDTLYRAEKLTQDFQKLSDGYDTFLFPAEELMAAEIATSSPEFRAQRVKSLDALQNGENNIIVTSVSGLKRRLPNPKDFNQKKLNINFSNEYELQDLIKQLQEMSYQRVKMVSAPGEFSVRGSILDIYALNHENPIRIDLFDTEIDSIRYFEVDTQRSMENIDEVEILPANDFLPTANELNQAVDNLSNKLTKELKKLEDDEQKDKLKNQIETIIESLKSGVFDSKWIEYSQYIFDGNYSLVDYLDDDRLVVFDEFGKVKDNDKELTESEFNWKESILINQEVFSDQTFTLEFKDIFKQIQQPILMFSLFKKGLGRMKIDSVVDVVAKPMQQFFGQMPLLKTEIDRYQKEKRTVLITVSDQERLNKVKQIFDDFEISLSVTNKNEIIDHQVQILIADIDGGFEIPAADIALITETEMFQKVNAKKKNRVKHQNFSNAEKIKSYTDLKPGDYVVHVNHGIGRYEGMKTMEVDQKHQDYMTITYKDGAQIFIPVTQLNLIQKYVAGDNKIPKINKLGGSEWAKTKSKVSSKIEDIADDLIDLYAKREAQKGFAFPVDDDMQIQFENDFPYNETPDQLKSIQEIKDDMEKPNPMDRLLVGDVGYGKTEVALRAAFKAVEGGKQVALLVPTTVLAQQHYETMLNRYEGYPINVSVISRFNTKKESNQVIDDLKEGKVDILVGTHRLLSKDVKFNDLGLLIVDEEQRFGVKHKERIKELRANVDVLTLTATPIPRTLNMSMMGVRDLSVIETPPANRFPIQTYVMEQNEATISEGIRREMQRNGQVFYLHNRVDDIEKVVNNLQRLNPDANISYIHGQMTETQMENILYEFINHEYDVLVTTTIIETGVDIPNANTLFVENADQMGLSQLYQIRGRIGRSNRIGQAYFMYKPNKVLTEVSESRLEAIKDFTELGSGFKIAMRDLSIRGAGNLLGKQQHGFIDSVGYDLYTAMLTDAVKEKQGKKRQRKVDSKIELDIEAYLPNDYIDDSKQKIEIYKRLRQVDDENQIRTIEDDLIDRFGDFSEPVQNLLTISTIKMFADVLMINLIKKDKNNLVIEFNKKSLLANDTKKLVQIISQTKFRSTIKEIDDKIKIKLVIQPTMTEQDWLNELLKFIQFLDDMRQDLESRYE